MATSTRTAYVGATLIDATGASPLPRSAVVVEGENLAWVGAEAERPTDVSDVVDLSGKYLIPGLMDANVHLVGDVLPDVLLRYDAGQYDDLVLEAAQVTLRAGITTVFDTWGPLEALIRVRDRIRAGSLVGSSIYAGGNIIGLGGPYTDDFLDFHLPVKATLSPKTIAEINHHWEHGTGPDLLWMDSEDLRAAVRKYISAHDIDFVKYASSAHTHARFLAFSPDSQRAIVEEAHAAGLKAQACAHSPEALKMAIDAGVDLLQHGSTTGPYEMPERTFQRILDLDLPCVAFLTTELYNDSLPMDDLLGGLWRQMMLAKDANDRRLIDAGARLMLANDMHLCSPTTMSKWGEFYEVPDHPRALGTGHLLWMKAAFERGMDPLQALQAATRNIADAYGIGDEVGTLEPGKRADMLVLDRDPLTAAENYSSVHMVVKDGRAIDYKDLPERPVMTG